MATAQTEARLKPGALTRPNAGAQPPRNTRRNEIVAIALLALSLLIALCLVSYNSFDDSWNTSDTGEVRNLIGAVGANLSAALFQGFGFAAALLPLLLAAAAWRRFRTRRLHAPLSRVVGLVALVFSAAALLSLFVPRESYGGSFEAGGVAGVFIAEHLRGALNTVGASVMLAAVAATGLLLATNFSFARAYDRVVAALNNPSGVYRTTRERVDAWREARRERAAARVEARSLARAERERETREALNALQTSAGVASSATPTITAATKTRGQQASQQADAQVDPAAAIQRSAEAASDPEAAREAEIRAKLARAEAELAAIAADPFAAPVEQSPLRRRQSAAATPDAATPAATTSPDSVTPPASAVRPAPPATQKRTAAASPAKETHAPADDDAEVEEMMREAEVVRTEAAEETPSERKRAAAEERAAQRAAPPSPAFDDYTLPVNSFLNAPTPRHEQADEELLEIATRVAEKCKEFNVTGQIKHICPGPVVTTYEFKPDPGVKYSRVTGLVDDLCIALEAESVRIDRLPGKPHVGIEVPNPQRETIMLREVIESRQFRESPSKLTIALGKTIDGMNYVADLARMPHLLIAGATGTGKSVCLNSLVVSILYKAHPDEVKFIMIDPKRLELGLYADIPHLATQIITEPKRAANALKWAVAQMEQRYKQLAQWGVRNIDGYNAEVERRNNVLDFDDEGNPHKPLAYIVIIIDELADLMMTCGSDVEEAITRLAQMARAVGIHLVLATQRPSVDVITGLIKANFPSRIAFRVSSKVDSRTIIDANGAEQLLGRGDMLFLPPGTSRLVRVHGAYLDEAEVGRVVAHIKEQGKPVYDETITQSEEEASGLDDTGGERDELFEQALRICCEMKRASTSVLQRRLRIGYGRAAAILDAMEREGFIGQADGARPRPVLGKAYETLSHWDDLGEETDDGF
ncbi:MAG TPA: DNA translocase FtsK [Pyrinomonadaceae bacterium]|nr:DNA translocase FtsK [Pyrinomonadaceae bacterium]